MRYFCVTLLRCCVPVSYTHLDVYKRQIQEHAVTGGVERAVADEDGVFLALKLDPQDDQHDNENTQRYEIRYFGAFLFHVCDLPPHKLVVNMKWKKKKNKKRLYFFKGEKWKKNA